MKIKVEFSGGLDTLFGGVKEQDIDVASSGDTLAIKDVVYWLRDNLLKERSELFLSTDINGDQTVRPGILVLVNDTDWELLDGDRPLDAALEANDRVTFISTLHGG